MAKKKETRKYSAQAFLCLENVEKVRTFAPKLIVETMEELYSEIECLQNEYSKDLIRWISKRNDNIEKVEEYIKKINNREINFKRPRTSYKDDCGPQVISYVTGLSVNQIIDDMEFANLFQEQYYGTYPHEIIKTLEFYGVIGAGERFRNKRNIHSIDQTSILGLKEHWVLLVVDKKNDDRYVMDPAYDGKARRDFNRLGKLECYLPLDIFDL
ncbi:MAG: hypothetical protein OHK0056_33340 [Bacteriovoracaceae bacterium]